MASLPITHAWKLAAHVRACACDGQVILLDLRNSRYLGLGGPASLALADRVDKWPACSPLAGLALGPHAAENLVRKLSQKGLLAPYSARAWTAAAGTTGEKWANVVRDRLASASSASVTGEVPGLPRDATAHDVARPGHHQEQGLEEATATLALDGIPFPTQASTRIAVALRFAHSVARASCALRCRSLLVIATSVAAGRDTRRAPHAQSLEAMKPAVAAYERLRPYLFTARAQCLLDSLALVGFLARTGHTPRWVVGVRTGPFAAHSWVQNGNTVLNDQHEYVRQFRPILVV